MKYTRPVVCCPRCGRRVRYLFPVHWGHRRCAGCARMAGLPRGQGAYRLARKETP